MLKKIICHLIAGAALNHNRFVGLYRRLCHPTGSQWACYLARHGRLHAIGKACVVQANVVFTDPNYVQIGNNVHMTGCVVFGHDGSVNMIKSAYGIAMDRVGKICILDNVFIGHQAIIMPGVTIGPNAIVAAGSVVTHDVPAGMVVAGIPAKPIMTMESHIAKLKEQFEKLPWKDHPKMSTLDWPPSDATLEQSRLAHFFGPSV